MHTSAVQPQEYLRTSKTRRQGRKANRPPVGGSQEHKKSENATASEVALVPVLEPMSGITSAATRSSGEEIRDSLLTWISAIAYRLRTNEDDDEYIPDSEIRCGPIMGGILDDIVEGCHELLAIINIQMDMVRGLEEEVVRILAEREEKLAGAEEEKKSLQLQVDAELRKKKEISEEESKEVRKEWAVHSFFFIPKTWKEIAEKMGKNNEGMRAEKKMVKKERDEAREETKREVGALQARLVGTEKKTEALRAMLMEARKKVRRLRTPRWAG